MIPKIKQKAIKLQGAIEKRGQFDVTILNAFWVHQYYFRQLYNNIILNNIAT